MTRIIIVYGVIAGAIIIAAIILGVVLNTDAMNSAWAGYAIMLAALSLIFIGVKRYRDTAGGGVIRFTTALGVGLGIAAVASVIYVAGWELYLWVTHYTFFDAYAKGVLQAKRASGASAAEVAGTAAELAAMATQYTKPLNRMVMTLFEILPVGVVVAVISAVLLRNSRFLPWRGKA